MVAPSQGPSWGVIGVVVGLLILVVWQWPAISAALSGTATVTVPAPKPGSVVTPSDGVTGVTKPPTTGKPVQSVAPKYPTNWSCVGDIDVPIRRESNANNDISCLSTDGLNCAWGGCASRLAEFSSRQNELKPLVCGAMHQGFYGDTGYDNPIHWCFKGNAGIPK
jgi:hypothetical protein